MALVCAGLCMVAFNAGQASVTASSKPRGLMYDIGGRRMRLVCEGPSNSGKPEVLIESGAFGFSGDWAYVQDALTNQGVRSCAYDRAGMGLSDTAPSPRDGLAVAKDLETLLAVAHEPGPYILVGHSMAGVRVHLFANRNPSKVAGLVLVDSTTPEAMTDPGVAKYAADFAKETHAAALTARFGILKLLAATAYEEVKYWPLAAAQARATGPLNPHWPVAVVSAGVLDPDEGQAMLATQRPPAVASDHGYVDVVQGATHNGLLGAAYSPAIVKGIDFVVHAATADGRQARAETVIRSGGGEG
jgi:pimeloyl-ACP methyl ester carboxylesterase